MQASFKTTCCYCGVGCGIVVHKDRQGKLHVEGDKTHPVNKGMLCSKGMNLHYTVMDTSDRLLYPEMRYHRNLPRQRVTWDQALERTAAVFAAIIKKHGPDAVAFYASGQCLTEEYYVVNKLIKGFIGSNNIDTNSRLCMSSAVVAYKMALGEDAVPGTYDDIEQADCIFVAGANPAWCHPILWRRVEAAKAANPAMKIIVSDPRVTQSCALADLHLQVNPGTDIVLHHAIGRALITAGHTDSSFVEAHTNGFDKYKDTVMERTIEEAAAICGIAAEDIHKAADYIGNATGFMTLWTMGLNQSSVGVHKNLSLINLHLITGHIGKPGSGPFSLTGQPNAMGGREVGGLSNLLPAHRALNNPAHRKEVQAFWGGTELSDKPGLTATEMFTALNDGRLKAIWIMCTNPLVSLPDARFAEAALQKAKYVVVQEISSKPETLRYADVVLPAAAWTEKEGTMTNAERRISYLTKVTDAPGEALPDAEIICRFAQKMGYHGFDYTNVSEIYDEHCRLTAGTNIDVSELNYDIIKAQRSVQWPYQSGNGTPRLFRDHRFYTPDERAVIHSFDDDNRSEPLSNELPLILTTGRIRDQWHTMSKTGKVSKLKQHISSSFLEIHPEDARQRGISADDIVTVTNGRGTVRVKAQLSTTIKKGVVFLPMHWGKILHNDLHRANNLTSPLLDPLSKQPDFKYAAVQVARYRKPVQKIVIIGAGAGACGFVKSYRELNTSDEIVVFSKEDLPFYNRVMLPDYISGTQQWKQLVKMTRAEEKSYNITLHRGVSITHIDRNNKLLTDSNGNVHTYDILLMATGSRAATLRDIPPIPGIFTMRTRMDADAFKQHIDPSKGKVMIAGGGLLGIELAASLKEINIDVGVIQRTSRLMDRQLDTLGGQLLYEELTDRGIDIYYNDEINRFSGQDQLEGIQLKSGLYIPCQAVVMSIGTVPNIELAQAAQLECNRGVVVNEYLQTSDPDIYAIGEIAAFNGTLYGITAAAEQQAEVVARYLNGDISNYYQGSLFMNILKMHGTDLCSLGMVETPKDPAYEEVVFIDKAKRYYKKCIIHQDRLVGAILIGDKSEFIEFRDLIQQKIELSDKRLELLRSGKKGTPVVGRLVCSCGNVGEGNIMEKIAGGCDNLQQLCQASGAGLGCGSCKSEVKALLEKSIQKTAAALV
ncbi:nitrate reductase [Chitinophaga ginsengisegetis]|uniref:nitrate reductase n=1 Tax=Chitinophaga ginsengisegetis TaxID=393003 RepID=UPI000DBAAB66|nr:nitrate reductase [Chitinophaga ginsengisegetis]MDR6567322.1 ferredoxin-nitrate reductase [Chitinophaga ginsengisegetis]MDR6647053.1 ferredoxin-nitrate reductase [Chitinophaga ginsengisegetis]MDR6653402.1 ferredoxin-nitrate reductase [Chitinophaga ginsengisegetis]